MRKRWQVLSAISSFGIMGFMAAIARYGFEANLWVLLGIGGFAAACGISLWAAIVDYHGRWPAAIALIAFAPFAQRLYELVSSNLRWVMSSLDLLSLQIIASSLGTVIAAIVILSMRVPPREDPITAARIV